MTLSMADLDEIGKIVEEKIEDKISGLPTRDEFFGKMDEMMGELKTIREEQTMISHRVPNHEDRFQVIEDKLDLKPSTI